MSRTTWGWIGTACGVLAAFVATTLLMDGGRVMAPRWAIYGLTKEWEVENHGITPDYDVELDPAAWRNGQDTQLDRAIQVILQLMEKNPPKEYPRPPYPNYQPKRQTGLQ